MTAGVAVAYRDLWLAQAVGLLRPVLAGAGVVVPERITVQAAALGAGAAGVALTGLSWPSAQVPEGVPHVAISREVAEPVAVLSALVHELLVVADRAAGAHGGLVARSVGTVGLVWSDHDQTSPGPRLRRQLGAVAAQLGPYPSSTAAFVVALSGRVWA